MENANPSSSTSNSEFFDPKKKIEIESWLEDSRIVGSLVALILTITSIHAIKAHSKEANISQTSLLRPEMEIETQQTEEPEPTLEDEFQDLHLNLLVFEVLAHALIYNAILDKYVESLELCKNGSTFVQGEVHAKWKTPGYSPYLVD
ncbi:hypothetical protein Tco_0030766 [Tanacetum coccineum]